MTTKLGRYIHFEGNEYEAANVAAHSETHEEMVIYHAPDDTAELWVCPAVVWNESIEHNGRKVKRFIHIDEMAQLAEEPPDGIHMQSPSDDKIALFMSLFTGREDVYAKRWEKYQERKIWLFSRLLPCMVTNMPQI